MMFAISFLILFLELALIRFIPSQIRYVGFFSNIILLASFVGIGLGTLFWHKIKFGFHLFPLLLLLFKFLLDLLKYDLIISSDQVIYFNVGFGRLSGEPIFLLPLIFFLVVAIFLLPAKFLGEQFSKLPPLSAYWFNTAGSVTGILCFSLLSFFHSGPTVWFGLIFIISVFLVKLPAKKNWGLLYLLLFIILIGPRLLNFNKTTAQNFREIQTLWSPYYKVTLFTINKILTLNVNNIGHQIMVDPNSANAETFYQYPYRLFPERKFAKVLIIGAGAGNDVAQALEKGADKVTAVEIDPVIVDLGKKYHPKKPYSSDKVAMVVDDGRSFLVNSKEKFDLIIFALTDSLTLSSAASSLRLESYLFTRESFMDAKKRLNDHGLLVLYNYYRSYWVVDKLAGLMRDTFEREPLIISTPTSLGPAAVIIGAKGNLNFPPASYKAPNNKLIIPTDDWPFLYLKEKTIPNIYLSYLTVIMVVLGLIFILFFKKTKIKFVWSLFFMGAAFMLLETKNVVQFSLLFGSTWLTNSFVFSGLLILVLLAILLAKKISSSQLPKLYLLLFLLIAVNYFFPQRQLLAVAYLPRLIFAILLNFSPVFIANLIFALLFKETKTAPAAYGANIFGSFIGGIFEYSSLMWGYKNLMFLVAFFYLLSLLFALKLTRVRFLK